MNPPIEISVKPQYIESQSDPVQAKYVFAYTITIANLSDKTTQLISRHWIITDDKNQIQEVKGLGVVGQQPKLEPGSSFTYTSSAILATENGIMTGSYQMRLEDNTNFEVPIPTFALVHPKNLH
jgi:ApaG protein